jgi:hypothetical protein
MWKMMALHLAAVLGGQTFIMFITANSTGVFIFVNVFMDVWETLSKTGSLRWRKVSIQSSFMIYLPHPEHYWKFGVENCNRF